MDPRWQVFSYDKTHPNQMQLYPKLEIWSNFFSKFLKFTLNFEYFQKKYDPYSWFTFDVIGCKKPAYLNS